MLKTTFLLNVHIFHYHHSKDVFLQILNVLVHQLKKTIYIEKSGWLRAKCSGLFIDNNFIGTFVKKGEVLGTITDPFGKFEQKVKAPNNGYVINANHSPIVYEGDAIYHLSNTFGDEAP